MHADSLPIQTHPRWEGSRLHLADQSVWSLPYHPLSPQRRATSGLWVSSLVCCNLRHRSYQASSHSLFSAILLRILYAVIAHGLSCGAVVVAQMTDAIAIAAVTMLKASIMYSIVKAPSLSIDRSLHPTRGSPRQDKLLALPTNKCLRSVSN